MKAFNGIFTIRLERNDYQINYIFDSNTFNNPQR
jgi:hypothetical protein